MDIIIRFQDIIMKEVIPSLAIWKKNQKVLYCTRPTVINKLYSEKVAETVIKTPCWIRKRIYYETLRRRTIFTRKTARENIKG